MPFTAVNLFTFGFLIFFIFPPWLNLNFHQVPFFVLLHASDRCSLGQLTSKSFPPTGSRAEYIWKVLPSFRCKQPDNCESSGSGHLVTFNLCTWCELNNNGPFSCLRGMRLLSFCHRCNFRRKKTKVAYDLLTDTCCPEIHSLQLNYRNTFLST